MKGQAGPAHSRSFMALKRTLTFLGATRYVLGTVCKHNLKEAISQVIPML